VGARLFQLPYIHALILHGLARSVHSTGMAKRAENADSQPLDKPAEALPVTGVSDAPGSAGASPVPALRPLPGDAPGEGGASSEPPKPARRKQPTDKKLKVAKKFGPKLQRAMDEANSYVLQSSTGFVVDFKRIAHPDIPVDYRVGKDGLEFVSADLGTAIAFHAQELGLDSVDKVFAYLDSHPRAVACVGILGAIVVNALHVRGVAQQCATQYRTEQSKPAPEAPTTPATADDIPVVEAPIVP
jgi:hypothetical protein